MKKTAIALAVFATALFAVSCQKENTPEQNVSGPMTVSAVTEGIGVGAKADLAYKYDVLWKEDDEICVKNSSTEATFTLIDGMGTTKGTFSSSTSISGEVEAFYPARMKNLVWDANQQNNQVPPMYCKKNLTSTQNQTFNFTSLGSVLQLAFNSTTEDITVKTVEVSADEAMSGAFTINEEGKAEIVQPEGDKPGITLDLGEGVAMGTSAKYFNIAIPSGTYTALTIVLTATDESKCTIKAKKALEIEHNTVYRLTISGEFKGNVLPGVFSVGPNATDKVHFSKGNLYCSRTSSESDDWTWHFYDEQYAYNSLSSSDSREVGEGETEIDLFTWGYGSWSTSPTTQEFLTGHEYEPFSPSEDWGNTIDDKGTWRTLTMDEWQYLTDTPNRMVYGKPCYSNAKGGVTIGDATYKGIFLYPDDYSGKEVVDNTETWTWDKINSAGIVFLPAAGCRDGSDVYNVGRNGYYWSSTADGEDSAYIVMFTSRDVSPDYDGSRNSGYSVRLITESK